MRKFIGKWKPLAAIAAAVLLGATSLLVGDSTGASAANEVEAVAGGGEAGIAVNVFSPATIAVNVGDTVTWVNPYTEPHSVAFQANDGVEIVDAEGPLNAGAADSFDASETFSSGLYASAGMFAAGGDSFSVTFETSGVYTFFCTIHPGMEVTVSVLNGINPPPIDMDRVDARIAEGIELGLAAADAIEVPGPTTGPGGTKIWTIPTPPAVPYEGSVVDVLRFTPFEVNIGVGDTVTWLNDSFTPHTVTFLPGPPPEGFSPFVPGGVTSSYSPGQFLNSGILANGIVGPVFGAVGSEFSLTFGKAGTYQYICALHADSGMVGVINVGTGGGTITPPSTGDAGLAEGSSGSWMVLAGAAMLLTSMVAGTFVLARRQA